jgi:hypothetical protein
MTLNFLNLNIDSKKTSFHASLSKNELSKFKFETMKQSIHYYLWNLTRENLTLFFPSPSKQQVCENAKKICSTEDQ